MEIIYDLLPKNDCDSLWFVINLKVIKIAQKVLCGATV